MTIHFNYNLWELRAQVREFEPSLPVPKMMFLNSVRIKSNRNIPQVSTLEHGLILNASISNQHEKLKHWYLPWPGSLMLSYDCLTAWFTVCHSLLSPQGTAYMAQVLQSQLCCGRPPAKPIQKRRGPARRDGPQRPRGAVPCWQLQLNDRLLRSTLYFNFCQRKIFRKVYFIRNLFSAEKSTSQLLKTALKKHGSSNNSRPFLGAISRWVNLALTYDIYRDPAQKSTLWIQHWDRRQPLPSLGKQDVTAGRLPSYPTREASGYICTLFLQGTTF